MNECWQGKDEMDAAAASGPGVKRDRIADCGPQCSLALLFASPPSSPNRRPERARTLNDAARQPPKRRGALSLKPTRATATTIHRGNVPRPTHFRPSLLTRARAHPPLPPKPKQLGFHCKRPERIWRRGDPQREGAAGRALGAEHRHQRVRVRARGGGPREEVEEDVLESRCTDTINQ